MSLSKKPDIKTYAAVWRRYEGNLGKVVAPITWTILEDGVWNDDVDYGAQSPPLHSQGIRLTLVAPQNAKPWMRPNPYEKDGTMRTETNPELEARHGVLDAAEEWATLLQPLSRVESYSVPQSDFGPGVLDIRSPIYSSSRIDPSNPYVEIAWTNECAAPMELLRLASTRWDDLDNDGKEIVISALAGWLSTKMSQRFQISQLTDADFVVNVCLAIAGTSLFPPIVTQLNLPKQTPFFNPSMVHVISRSHSTLFGSWFTDFFKKSVRDPENEIRKQHEQNIREVLYGISRDDAGLVEEDITGAFISSVDPAQVFETHEEVDRLTRGLSQEEIALLDMVAQGNSIDEVAKRLIVHKSTAHTRLLRVRQKISRKNNLSN